MKPIPWDDEQHDHVHEDAYRPDPEPNPRCAICGAEMAIKRIKIKIDAALRVKAETGPSPSAETSRDA